MRNALWAVAILAGLFLAPVIGSHDRSSVSAKDNSRRIENAPCAWFTELFPGAWGTDQTIMINPRTVIARKGLVRPRDLHTSADCTDAFEYLERKCGEN